MKIADLKEIYFVCTGNTCRSPMAQRIMIEKLREQGLKDISVQSRKVGIKNNRWTKKIPGYSFLGESISPEAKQIILNKYGDEDFVKKHRSKYFTDEEFENADLVITMDLFQRRELILNQGCHNGEGALKVYSLGELVGQPQEMIEDPMLDFYSSYGRSYGYGNYQNNYDSAPKSQIGFNFTDKKESQREDSSEKFKWACSLDREDHSRSYGISDSFEIVPPQKTFPMVKAEEEVYLPKVYVKVFDQLERMIAELLEGKEIPLRTTRPNKLDTIIERYVNGKWRKEPNEN